MCQTFVFPKIEKQKCKLEGDNFWIMSENIPDFFLSKNSNLNSLKECHLEKTKNTLRIETDKLKWKLKTWKISEDLKKLKKKEADDVPGNKNQVNISIYHQLHNYKKTMKYNF